MCVCVSSSRVACAQAYDEDLRALLRVPGVEGQRLRTEGRVHACSHLSSAPLPLPLPLPLSLSISRLRCCRSCCRRFSWVSALLHAPYQPLPPPCARLRARLPPSARHPHLLSTHIHTYTLPLGLSVCLLGMSMYVCAWLLQPLLLGRLLCRCRTPERTRAFLFRFIYIYIVAASFSFVLVCVRGPR